MKKPFFFGSECKNMTNMPVSLQAWLFQVRFMGNEGPSMFIHKPRAVLEILWTYGLKGIIHTDRGRAAMWPCLQLCVVLHLVHGGELCEEQALLQQSARQLA